MASICPKCNSERVRRSRRRGALERIFSVIGLSARRCHDCNVRFVAIGNSMLFRSDLDVLLRKISLIAMAGFAVLAVILLVLWLSRN